MFKLVPDYGGDTSDSTEEDEMDLAVRAVRKGQLIQLSKTRKTCFSGQGPFSYQRQWMINLKYKRAGTAVSWFEAGSALNINQGQDGGAVSGRT